MKKVTYQQVADALNISRVTVWKAVNDKPGIAPDTKRSILQKAVEMGYPISIADSKNINVVTAPPKASSPSIKNCNVAVVVSRPETSTFWMNIIHHQAIALASHEVNMMYVYLPPTYSDDFTLPNCLTDGSVSGIIVMNIYDPRLFLALNNLELPKVFLDCPTNTSFSSLNGDLFLIEGRANTEEIVERIEVDFDIEKTNLGQAKKIAQLSLEGHVVQEFESISDATRKMGISSKHIQNELSKEKSNEWKIL